MTLRNSADLRSQLDIVSRELDEVSVAGEEVNLIEQAYAVGIRNALRWALGEAPTV